MKIPKLCQPYIKDPLFLYEQYHGRKLSAHTFITYVSCILSLSALSIGYIIAHSQSIIDHLFFFHTIPFTVTTTWESSGAPTMDRVLRTPLQLQQDHQSVSSSSFIHTNDQAFQEAISYFYFAYYAGLTMGSLLSFIPCDMSGRKKTMLYSIVSTVVLLLLYMFLLDEESVIQGELKTIRFLLGGSQGVLLISSMIYIVEISAVYNRGKNLAWIPIQFILGKFTCTTLFSLNVVINAPDHSFVNFSWYSTLFPVVIILGVMFYCSIFFPESPRWLLAMKTPTDCSDSLKVLRREMTALTTSTFHAYSRSAKSQSQSQRSSSNQTAEVHLNHQTHTHSHQITPAISSIKEEFSFMYRALSTDARLEDTLMDLLSNQTISIRLGQCIGMIVLTTVVINPDWLCSFAFHLYVCITQSYDESKDATFASTASDSSSSSKNDGDNEVSETKFSAIRFGLCGYLLLLLIALVGGTLARIGIDKYNGRRNTILKSSNALMFVCSFILLGGLLWIESKQLQSSEKGSYHMSQSDDDIHHDLDEKSSSSSSNETISWLLIYFLHVSIWIVTCICMYVYSNGIQCLQYVYGLEIFPYRARAKMISLWIGCMFFINGIVSQLYVKNIFDLYTTSSTLSLSFHLNDATHLVEVIDGRDSEIVWLHLLAKLFLITGGIIIPFVLFCVYFTLPETSGVFLEDVEGLFDLRHVSYCCSIFPFIYQSPSNNGASFNSQVQYGGIGYSTSSPQASYHQNVSGSKGFSYGSPSNNSSNTEIEMIGGGAVGRNGTNKNHNNNNNRLFASPIYEPSALHKYSHEMKESKFLFFSPNGSQQSLQQQQHAPSSLSSIVPTPPINNSASTNSRWKDHQDDGYHGRYSNGNSYGLITEAMPLNPSSSHHRDSSGSGYGGYGSSSQHDQLHFCPDECDDEIDDGLIVKPFTIDFGK